MNNQPCIVRPTLVDLNTDELNYYKVLNIIKGINESKTLIKHISCEFRYEFHGKKRNSKQKWNNDK